MTLATNYKVTSLNDREKYAPCESWVLAYEQALLGALAVRLWNLNICIEKVDAKC